MSIHIEKIGQGEPLIMLHGWGMHSGMWMQTRDILSQHFALYMVDFPGMGHSETITPYKMQNLVQLIKTELAKNRIPANANLLAWSLGSLVGMKLAMEIPIKKLVLVGSTPCYVNRDDWQLGTPLAVFNSFFSGMLNNFKATMNKLLALIALGGHNPQATSKVLREVFASRPLPNQQALQATLDILLETDVRSEISMLTMPTLVIHGDYDKLCPIEGAEWLAKALPNAQFIKMQHAAHEPFISHPQAFSQHVSAFLSA
jgi:pimeloyl-[acyl-carrier protein] methyl ester esterase